MTDFGHLEAIIGARAGGAVGQFLRKKAGAVDRSGETVAGAHDEERGGLGQLRRAADMQSATSGLARVMALL